MVKKPEPSGSPRTLPGQHRGERQEADVQVIKVNDEATRDQIAEAIAELRRRAKRLPRVSRQRDVLDEEVDALVDDWLRAEV